MKGGLLIVLMLFASLLAVARAQAEKVTRPTEYTENLFSLF